MPEDIDKAYVEKYISLARSTDSELIKNDALYRAGTQMEIIDCNGDNNLTPLQQQTVLDTAEKHLTSDTDISRDIYSPNRIIWGDND